MLADTCSSRTLPRALGFLGLAWGLVRSCVPLPGGCWLSWQPCCVLTFCRKGGHHMRICCAREPWWGLSLVAPWPIPAPTLVLTSPFATPAACLWSGMMLLVLLHGEQFAKGVNKGTPSCMSMISSILLYMMMLMRPRFCCSAQAIPAALRCGLLSGNVRNTHELLCSAGDAASTEEG